MSSEHPEMRAGSSRESLLGLFVGLSVHIPPLPWESSAFLPVYLPCLSSGEEFGGKSE